MVIKAPTSGLNLASPPSLNSYFFNGAGALRSAPVRRIKSVRFRSRAFQIQMNLFDRIARVAKSYANAVVNSLEDPEKILDQAVLEMNDDLIKMRQTTAQVLATQKRLENKYKAAEQSSDDWYKRAQLALQKGDEELAREALKRRKSYADSASSLKTQLDQQKGVIESLISNSKVLESKIQEAKAKKDTLKARAQTAKTATKVNEMLGNVNTSSALSAFDKMEEKVMTMESQAEALNQLNADELDGKFAMLETSSVDDDLANMKKELSGVSLIIGAILLLLTITSTIFAFLSSTFVATRFLIILIFLVAASAAVVAAVAGLVAAVAATTIMTAAASITTLVGTVVVVATTISWISAFVITIVMGIAVVAVLGGSKRKRQKRRTWW